MGVLTPLAVRIGALPWMPRLLPQIVWVDTRLRRLTRGRLTLLDVAGLPNLVLTVPGRRSGIPRGTPLLCVPDAGTWLVAGSFFGGPHTPEWVHNLRAAGRARITLGRKQFDVTAAEIPGPGRAEVWAVMTRTWPNFRVYRERTDREIPLFRLTPDR
jgi:deazaflavin-dependent oxidoreductase (nitroreductase family)